MYKILILALIILILSLAFVSLNKTVEEIAEIGSPLNLQVVEPIPDELKIKSTKEAILASKDYIEVTGEIVTKYAYMTEVLPNKLSPNEIKELRTNKSYTELISENQDGTETRKLNAFSGNNFVEDGTVWRQVEYATTTKDAYDLQTKTPLGFLINKVYAATFDDTSDVADNGNSNYYCLTWATCRDAASGRPALGTVTATSIADSGFGYTAGIRTHSSNGYGILRGWASFDTSGIDDSATISSSTISLEPNLLTDGVGASFKYTTIQGATLASSPTVANGDFGATTTYNIAEKISHSVTSADITAGIYTEFGVTATSGFDHINLTGNTDIVIVGGDDFENNPTGYVATTYGAVRYYSGDQTGTAEDPRLVVIYTVPGGADDDIHSQEPIWFD